MSRGRGSDFGFCGHKGPCEEEKSECEVKGSERTSGFGGLSAGHGVVPSMETGRQWAGRDEQKDESVTTLTSDRAAVNPSTHTRALMGACLHTHVHMLPCIPAHFFALCPHTWTQVWVSVSTVRNTLAGHVCCPGLAIITETRRLRCTEHRHTRLSSCVSSCTPLSPRHTHQFICFFNLS